MSGVINKTAQLMLKNTFVCESRWDSRMEFVSELLQELMDSWGEPDFVYEARGSSPLEVGILDVFHFQWASLPN